MIVGRCNRSGVGTLLPVVYFLATIGHNAPFTLCGRDRGCKAILKPSHLPQKREKAEDLQMKLFYRSVFLSYNLYHIDLTRTYAKFIPRKINRTISNCG
jgi:hypothetical protein